MAIAWKKVITLRKDESGEVQVPTESAAAATSQNIIGRVLKLKRSNSGDNKQSVQCLVWIRLKFINVCLCYMFMCDTDKFNGGKWHCHDGPLSLPVGCPKRSSIAMVSYVFLNGARRLDLDVIGPTYRPGHVSSISSRHGKVQQDIRSRNPAQSWSKPRAWRPSER